MTIQITICTDGDAFADDAENQIFRILFRLSHRIPDVLTVDSSPIVDLTGNQCGTIEVKR